MSIFLDSEAFNMNCVTKGICVFLLFCVLHGSDVSVSSASLLSCDMYGLQDNQKQECVRDVKKIFTGNVSGKDNFLEAFRNYNLAHFEDNDNALYYFIDLLESVEDNNIVHSPGSFCRYRHPENIYYCNEAMYMLLANKNENHDAEVQRILLMDRDAAFKHFYLNLIYTKPSLLSYYSNPQQYDQYEQPEEDYDIDMNIDEQRFTDEPPNALDSRKKKILEFMNKYFKHQIRASQRIAEMKTFKNVEQYCGYEDTGKGTHTDSDE